MPVTRRQFELAELPGAFEQLRAEYIAGKTTRFQRTRTGLSLFGSGADYHYRSEGQYLRSIEYAWDMARNDTVVGAIVDRSIWNILQSGFGIDPQTGDAELDADLKAGYLEWAEDPRRCDAGGRFTVDEMAEHAARAIKIPGDMFFLPRDDMTLQMVEAQRCRTPTNTKRNVVHGVLLDEWRRPCEYWFTKDEVDPWQAITKVGEIERYPARDPRTGAELVWHIFDPRRCTQTRGITAFAPAFEELGMFEDVKFANLVKAQISSAFVFIRERPLDFRGGTAPQAGPRTTETMSDGESRVVESLAPGTEIVGRPGEVIKAFNPNVPNTEWFEHAKFTLQLICACVNLPLISFLLDGRETNFSGWRGAIDQAKIGWKREQLLLARLFHRKAYEHHVICRAADEPALARRLAESRARLLHVRINRPRWPYIEPLKDIEAAARERAALLISPRRQAQERGYDWEELVGEIVPDNERAITAAIQAARRVYVETGVAVDPIRLLNLDPKRDLASAEQVAAAERRRGENAEAQLAAESAAADLEFKRELVKLFAADGTIGDVMFNRIAAGALLKQVNVDVYTDADGNEIEEPWLPVETETGKLVGGQPVTDADNDVIGGGVKTGPELDQYGVGVRAGTLTPQSDDEMYFRARLGLPEPNEQTRAAWAKGARRPITLAEQEEDQPADPVERGGDEDEGDQETED